MDTNKFLDLCYTIYESSFVTGSTHQSWIEADTEGFDPSEIKDAIAYLEENFFLYKDEWLSEADEEPAWTQYVTGNLVNCFFREDFDDGSSEFLEKRLLGYTYPNEREASRAKVLLNQTFPDRDYSIENMTDDNYSGAYQDWVVRRDDGPSYTLQTEEAEAEAHQRKVLGFTFPTEFGARNAALTLGRIFPDRSFQVDYIGGDEPAWGVSRRADV